VCGRKGALDKPERAPTGRGGTSSQSGARDAIHERAEAARRQWEGLVILKGDALTRAPGLDLDELVEALGVWVKAGSITDLGKARRLRRVCQRTARGGDCPPARNRSPGLLDAGPSSLACLTTWETQSLPPAPAPQATAC
jgi:hypothetical protein